jgi:polysaccharide pyruvyl transferase WcaK-like protein
MPEKCTCAVHGSYFASNFGDTLLVRMMCDSVARIIGKENVYLAVAANKREQEGLGYPILPKELRRNVTHLIYAGGGYFGQRSYDGIDTIVWSLRNYIRHLSWHFRFKNARIAVIGVGSGPLTNLLFRRAVLKLLSKAEVLIFRDIESRQFAYDYGVSNKNVEVGVDFALSIPKSDILRSGIALHVPNLNIGELAVIFECLSSSFESLRHVDFIFDDPCGFTDKLKFEVCQLADLYDLHVDFIGYQSCDKMIELISKYKIIITSKLHVGIICIAQGGFVISIPLHMKTIRLYKQLGIEEFCIPRDHLTLEFLIAALNNLDNFIVNAHIIEDGIGKIEESLARFLAN